MAALPFLVVAVATAVAARLPIGRAAAGAFAAADALVAVGLVLGPFVLGIRVGALGWLAAILLSFAFGAGAIAWFFIRDRIVDAETRARRPSSGARPVEAGEAGLEPAPGGQELLVER